MSHYCNRYLLFIHILPRYFDRNMLPCYTLDINTDKERWSAIPHLQFSFLTKSIKLKTGVTYLGTVKPISGEKFTTYSI